MVKCNGTPYSLKDANLEPNSSYCWIAIPYSTSAGPWLQVVVVYTGNGGAAPEPYQLFHLLWINRSGYQHRSHVDCPIRDPTDTTHIWH